MPVGTARRLEAGMGGSQAGIEQSFAWHHEGLIRSPPAGGIALLLDHAQAITRSTQVLLITEHQIRLDRRAQRVDMAIGMFSRQHILVFGKRTEVVFFDKT